MISVVYNYATCTVFFFQLVELGRFNTHKVDFLKQNLVYKFSFQKLPVRLLIWKSILYTSGNYADETNFVGNR